LKNNRRKKIRPKNVGFPTRKESQTCKAYGTLSKLFAFSSFSSPLQKKIPPKKHTNNNIPPKLTQLPTNTSSTVKTTEASPQRNGFATYPKKKKQTQFCTSSFRLSFFIDQQLRRGQGAETGVEENADTATNSSTPSLKTTTFNILTKQQNSSE
jgi:hypothetical protein